MNARKTLGVVASVSFMFTLAMSLAVERLTETVVTDPAWLKTAGTILAQVGVFAIFFQVILALYTNFLFKKLDRRFDISGKWYQLFAAQDQQGSPPKIRHGVCRVDSTVDGISISAQSLREDNSFSSSWQSDTTTVIKNKLIVLYVSEGVRRHNPICTWHHGVPYRWQTTHETGWHLQ